jgi:hypothetical protein
LSAKHNEKKADPGLEKLHLVQVLLLISRVI